MSMEFLDKSGLAHFWSKIKSWVTSRGYITSSGSITGNAATASAVAWSGVTSKPTTIAGYGITDAKIANGTITLGSNSITPLTTHQSLDGKMTRGSYERIEGTSSAHKDLNSYTIAGFYNVKTANVDNCPSGIGIDAVLLVYPWNNSSYCTQELTESAASSDVRRWVRKLDGSVWSDWKQLAFQSSIPSIIQRTPDGTTYVSGATAGKALVNSTATSFGAVLNAPTKNYRVALATYPESNDNVLLYSVSNANIASNTNTTSKILAWGADNGTLSANTFLGDLSGNASSSTKLKTSRKIDAASFDGTSDIVVVPIGAIIYYAGAGTPENYLLCNGAAVSRTTYAALFSVIGTTYGAGDGSTTFNLPDLMNRFPQGSYTPGTKVDSGLPNITGTFRSGPADNSYWVGINVAFGAFEAIDWATYHPAQGGMASEGYSTKDGYTYCKLDASRSSSIYGASTVVQPPALTLRPIIKAL